MSEAQGSRRGAGAEGGVAQTRKPTNRKLIQGASAGRTGQWQQNPYPFLTQIAEGAHEHCRISVNDSQIERSRIGNGLLNRVRNVGIAGQSRHQSSIVVLRHGFH